MKNTPNPEKIHLYVFTDESQNPGSKGKEASDSRILRCVELFMGVGVEAFIERPEGGKPRMKPDAGIYFSLSHSGKYCICAVSRQEVGVDVQSTAKKYRHEIAGRFHPDERAYLLNNGYRDFFDVWTVKESYVKFTGQGIAGGLSTFSVVSDSKITDNLPNVNAQIKFIPLDPEYSLCLCAAKIGEISVVYINE